MTLLQQRLRALDATLGLQDHQGFIDTPLEGVRFFRATQPVPLSPLLYETGIIIVGQGYKVAHLDGRSFRYDAEQYLIVSVPLPMDCETHASEDQPLLGIFLDIDVVKVREIIAAVQGRGGISPEPSRSLQRGVEPASLDDAMLEATARLLHCLRNPIDVRVLGPAMVTEILYRALLGPHGPTLYALTEQRTPYARIARALSFAHQRYSEPISVDALARQATMSPSAFHRSFKRVTGASPLQYVKAVRLHKARGLLVGGGMTVSDAAFQVGYGSPAQFSREFKRFFGATPSEARHTGYAELEGPPKT
ncbi:MAG: AraC family transcriptional regulator [Acidobacteriota bacterium]